MEEEEVTGAAYNWSDIGKSLFKTCGRKERIQEDRGEISTNSENTEKIDKELEAINEADVEQETALLREALFKNKQLIFGQCPN